MTTENLFKFVAIRVPHTQQSRTTPPVSISNPDGSFVGLINRRAGSGVPLDRARHDVAMEFMNSAIYVPRNTDWRRLLPLEAALRRLMGEAHDADQLWEFIDQLFRARLGPEFGLERFVPGELFVRMKQALWRSYYSNLILLDRRGQDRSSLVFWIRLFHWLENAEDPVLAQQIFEQFERLRLAVPHLLVRMEKEKMEHDVPGDADKPDEARARDIAAVRSRIRALQTAQSKVNHLFTSRLIAFEADKAKSPLPRIVTNDTSDEIPPWRLKATELDYETNATLKQHGIVLELHDATRVESLLEQQIAREQSALYQLQRVEQITYVKGVPVKVRRRNGETP